MAGPEDSMCGRFTLHHSVEEIARRFGVVNIDADAGPRYNVAPTQKVAVVTGGDERSLRLFGWGLIPFWAKDPSIGNRMINARAETLAEKPAYKHAFARRRCLVPADGFYEWTKTGSTRTPMYIRFRDARLFAFAGIWEHWTSPDGEDVHTCSIVTVEPNSLVSSIHNRMPAILTPGEEDEWLAPVDRDPAAKLELLHPYEAVDEMEAFPVSRSVNSPAFDDPRCIDPAE
jgi:putative SOS response-associated peptidase YedK